MSDKQKIYSLLQTADPNNSKLALELVKGQSLLKKEIEEELLPILQSVGKKTLQSLPQFLQNIEANIYKALKNNNWECWGDSAFIKKWLHKLEMTDLILKETSISTLPALLTALKKLEKIIVSFGQITTLPPTIRNLKHLKVLNLSKNALQTVPSSIQHLKKLKKLYLGMAAPSAKQKQEIQQLLPQCSIVFS